MTTEITLFDQPTQVPAYLKDSATAKALAAQTEGGLASIGGNRISLRGTKFRLVKEGVEVGIWREPTLPVVIIAANPHVSRTYYIKPFSDMDNASRPDCYSRDGRTPEPDSPAVQSNACATCPQNVKGSAVSGDGKSKACSYGKRIIVTHYADIDGDAYALDVKSQGLFGDDNPAQKQFNLKSYIEALKANGLIVPSVVTALSFDDESSVPKLFFRPMRALTAAEWAQVEKRVNDPLVRRMLDDIDNKVEEGKPIGQQPALATPSAQPAPPAQPAGFPTGNGGAPAPKRGRPAKTETPPAPAPAPQAAPETKGFGMAAPETPPAALQTATPTTGKGFTVDLENYDD